MRDFEVSMFNPTPMRPNEDARIKRAVTPIFVGDVTVSRNKGAGTGVFVNIGGFYFLFTAGHVVEPIKKNGNKFSIALEGEKAPLIFVTECLFSFIKNGVDYGVIGLHGPIERLLDELEIIEWVNLDEMLVFNEKLKEEFRFSAIGFPGAGTFLDNNTEPNLNVHMTKFGGPLGPDNFRMLLMGRGDFVRPDVAGVETLEFTVPKSEVYIQLDEEAYSRDPNKLRGMSGGGFWLCPKDEDNPSEVKLFSLLSQHFDNEYIQNKKGEDCLHIRTIKISSHLYLVHQNYPMLRKLITDTFPILPRIWEEHIK
jgi:hypothetical protein